MNSSSKTHISTQPIVSYLDKTSKKSNIDINPHKNSCEKFCTCNSTTDKCPVNCSEFGNTFKLYEDKSDNGTKKFGFYSFCCLPVTIVSNTLLCGPCVLYNLCRNKCDNNKESKNYIC